MESIAHITHFVGLINIRKFKEQHNLNSAEQLKLLKITEGAVIEELQSIKLVSSQILEIEMSFSYPYDLEQRQMTNIVAGACLRGLTKFHDGQTLVDVRRAFVCQNMDKEIGTDVDQNPHKPLDCLGNNDLIHSFFYINNNIYVDSQPDKITEKHYVAMKKWAQGKGHTFEKVLSQETLLLDLEVVRGQRYFFQHLRGCEHTTVFLCIGFVQPHSSLDSYPIINDFHEKNLETILL